MRSSFVMALVLAMPLPAPGQALLAATRTNADALGVSHEIGTIETGKRADLLVLDANPAEDIGNVSSIRHVIRGGRVVE